MINKILIKNLNLTISNIKTTVDEMRSTQLEGSSYEMHVACDDGDPIAGHVVLQDIYQDLEDHNTYSVGKRIYCVVGENTQSEVSVIDLE